MYESLLENDPTIKQIKSQAKGEGKKEGIREGERKGALKARRQAIIDVVEARFPHLTEVATERVTKMRNLEALGQLMKQLIAAPDEAAARLILSTGDAKRAIKRK